MCVRERGERREREGEREREREGGGERMSNLSQCMNTCSCACMLKDTFVYGY